MKRFLLAKGAKTTIKYLKKLNYKIFVVTNQSGIARNFFKYRDVVKLHKSINAKRKTVK